MSWAARRTGLPAVTLALIFLVDFSYPRLLFSADQEGTIVQKAEDRFPTGAPDETVSRIEKEFEQQYNRCPPYEDTILSSFTYGLTPARPQTEPGSGQRFSVVKCYKPPEERGLGVVAIIMEDFGPREHSRKGYYLSYFLAGQKMYEQSFEASYGARYGFREVPSDPKNGPLLLVYRNEGANAREITYDLYRIQRESLKLLWRWKDEVSHSTSRPFSVSNVDLSEVAAANRSQIVVYTTSGSSEERPSHKKSTFMWDEGADTFVLQDHSENNNGG